MPGRIFISYRRDDVAGDARGIRDGLAARFGRGSVFMDVGASRTLICVKPLQCQLGISALTLGRGRAIAQVLAPWANSAHSWPRGSAEPTP